MSVRVSRVPVKSCFNHAEDTMDNMTTAELRVQLMRIAIKIGRWVLNNRHVYQKKTIQKVSPSLSPEWKDENRLDICKHNNRSNQAKQIKELFHTDAFVSLAVVSPPDFFDL